MNKWQPIDSAPRDGTYIIAKIPGHGSDNVITWTDGLVDHDGDDCGAWAFPYDEQEPPGCWTDGYCWQYNENGGRSIEPTHWRHLND